MRQPVAVGDDVAMVRLMLIDGRIAVGALWSFEHLGESLGVPTARAVETMELLATEGFVDLSTPGGFRIKEAAATEQDEVVQLRMLVEPPAMRQAAAHARAADVITLREVVADLGEAGRRRDFERYDEAVEGLYATTLRLVPNRQLAELVDDLRRRTRTHGVRQVVEAGLHADAAWRFEKFVDLVDARDLDGVERIVAAGLRHLRYLGAGRPATPYAVDEYPDNLCPIEVDDYGDTGW